MPDRRREFSSWITQLCALTVLAHRPHSPGSQHRQGRPALCGEQEAIGKQKQQRSSQALDVFCRLSLRRPEGVAVNVDGNGLAPSVLVGSRVCSWRRLAAFIADPDAPEGSDSRSSS